MEPDLIRITNFQLAISEFEIENFKWERLQNRSQRLDDAVSMVVVQHAVDAVLALALAGLSAEQVASTGIAVFGFAFRRHRETFLDSLVGFLFWHNELDGREIRKFQQSGPLSRPQEARKSGAL